MRPDFQLWTARALSVRQVAIATLPGDVSCDGGRDLRNAEVCARKVIAILTFVACAQLLTWPGPPPEAADSETTQAEAASLDSPRPDSSVVERGPEKAGVGGSIPSLATTF